MGNDSPLACCRTRTSRCYNYFKQLFAQVTNPPIDPIREAIVMSLNSFIGPKPNLLDINAVNPPMRLEVTQPILDFDDMARLRAIEQHTGGKFKQLRARHHLPAGWGREGVEAKLASLCAEASMRSSSGHNILIITDRRMDRDAGRDPGAAGAVGDPPAPGARRAAHDRRPGRRDRLGARGAPLRACSPATAPRRCTRTSRWRRWPRCTASCRAS